MFTIHPRIETYLETVDDHLQDPELPQSTAQSVRGELQRIARPLKAVTAPDGAVRYLQQYIERQYQRAQADGAHALPDGLTTTRTKPLCTCDDFRCVLKDGRLPIDVRDSDDPTQGIAAFRERHPRPTVLIEAQKAWDDGEAAVLTALGDCAAAIHRERTIDDIRDGRTVPLPTGPDVGENSDSSGARSKRDQSVEGVADD
jgi:hypothetical protein